MHLLMRCEVHMKVCKTCNEEKKLDKFVNQNGKYRNKCKECRNSERRIDKPRASFPKGHVPWNKGTKGLMNSWNKGLNPDKRYNEFYKKWIKEVKDRDGWKCTKCQSTGKLHAHHIVPWEKDENKRFDLDNGITLCGSCHGKLEGFQKGQKINLGRKITDEHRKNLSESHKGQKSWNKGLKKVKT